MNIAIDIDEVLLDFGSAFAGWNNYMYSEKADPNSKEYHMGIGSDLIGNRIDEFCKLGGYSTLKPVPGGIQMLNKLATTNTVHIVTHTPLEYIEERKRHLEDLGVNLQLAPVVCSDDKRSVFKELGCVVAIEDCPKVCIEATSDGMLVFTPLRKWTEELYKDVVFYTDPLEIVDALQGEDSWQRLVSIRKQLSGRMSIFAGPLTLNK